MIPKYDKYKDKECSLDMILPFLNKKNKYNILFPDYGEKEAFKRRIPHNPLVGYTLIFQNIPNFKEIYSLEFFKRYFIDKSYLINLKN